MSTTSSTTRAWLEIDATALRANLRSIREAAGAPVGLIPMVKADGYGLGMLEVVRALESEGVWGWGVAAVEEGLRLREAGVARPIVLFSPILPEQYERAVRHGLSVSVSEIAALAPLAEAATRVGRGAAFHLEVDTGMGRAGLDWRRAPTEADALFRMLEGDRLTWEGCYTHFHSADEPRGPEVDAQARRFETALEALAARTRPALVHTCNSAGVLRRPDLSADAIRPGIWLYGGSAGPDQPRSEPVAALRARVVLVRDTRAGDTVGYGATYRAAGPERWATISIGYGDGLPSAVARGGRVLVRGRSAPIIGRISMDVTVVDISDIDGVEVGDPVTFFGTDGTETVDLGEFASVAGTIDYEVLTGITPRVSRVWTG